MKRRGILHLVALMVLVVGSLLRAMYTYAPHAETGLTPIVLGLLCAAYALYPTIEGFQSGDRRRFVAGLVLLIVGLLCVAIAWQIPFCPACDGDQGTPLMRWWFPEWYQP